MILQGTYQTGEGRQLHTGQGRVSEAFNIEKAHSDRLVDQCARDTPTPYTLYKHYLYLIVRLLFTVTVASQKQRDYDFIRSSTCKYVFRYELCELIMENLSSMLILKLTWMRRNVICTHNIIMIQLLVTS